MPRLLLTNNHLVNFGGSEMVTLELAEEFVKRGWEVDVYTNLLGEPFVNEFEHLISKGSLEISDQGFDRALATYDLIWVHHAVIPKYIVEALGELGPIVPLVWHHMSPFPGIESPILAEVEHSFASTITCISPKTREVLGEYGLDQNQVKLLSNPAPSSFSETAVPEPRESLSNLAVISNHPPQELLSALEKLRTNGIAVKVIGGKHPQRVVPETLAGMDAVITIGKSVQYALSLGLPTYIYDHFGGEGWLTPMNFERERAFNFSGRSTERQVSADQLAQEILSGYEAARQFSLERIDHHRNLFSLTRHITDLLSQSSHSDIKLDSSTASSLARRWETFAMIQRDTTRALHEAWSFAASLEDQLQVQNEATQSALGQVETLRGSRSFALGNALLRPLKRFLG